MTQALAIEPLVLRLRRAWAQDSRAARGAAYVAGLDGWMAAIRSPHTRRAYLTGLDLFCLWYESVKGRLPLPHEVSRADASTYARWLSEQSGTLDGVRLTKSGRALDAAIWKILREQPGLHIDELRGKLLRVPGIETASVLIEGQARTVLKMEAADPYGFDKHLACLVYSNVLSRTPSLGALRQTDPHAGLGARVDPTIFAYRVNPHTRRPPALRAGTYRARLAALSSLWHYLVGRGENTDGYESPIRVNIWAEPTREQARHASEQARLSRERTTTDQSTLLKLLATAQSGSVGDLRDRAALLFFYWTGVRASELASIRRADVAWSADPDQPPTVRVVGKGQKVRELAIAPDAYAALGAFSSKLEGLARGGSEHAAHLLDPDAPLIPALRRWGCNSPLREEGDPGELLALDARRGLGRQAFNQLLWRRADLAAERGMAIDRARVHPHGLRHLAIRAALGRGTPVHIVKEVAGHSSSATTDRYAEVYDVSRLTLGPVAPAAPQAPRAPMPATVAPAVTWPIATPPTLPTVKPTLPQAQAAPQRVPAPARPAPPAAKPPAPTAPAGERLVQIGTLTPSPLMPAPDWAYTDPGREPRERLAASARSSDDTLPQTYLGTISRLLWWYGPQGKLEPRLPVPSPDQVAGAGADTTALADGLGALWLSWTWQAPPQTGPTAGAALLRWLDDALEVTSQAATWAAAHHRDWMPFEAAVGDPSPLGRPYQPSDLRAHRAGVIVDWFKAHAGSHLVSVGQGPGAERHSRVIDDPALRAQNLPRWFRDADPIRSLPENERLVLLGWLEALTAARRPEQPGETATVDVEQTGDLVGDLVAYSEAASRPTDARQARLLSEMAAYIRSEVTLLTGGRLTDFDVAALEKARRSEAMLARYGYPDALMRHAQNRKKFWQEVLASAIGRAGPGPRPPKLPADIEPLLDDERWRDLFRVDWPRQTIVHTPAFQADFMRQTGGHSECVARRLARYLWELRRRDRFTAALGKPERLLQRGYRSELIAQLAARTLYLVPCAHDLEAELRARAGSPRTAAPVRASFARHQQMIASEAELRRLTAAERRGLEARVEAHRAERAPLLFGKPTGKYKPNAGLLPNPVLLVLAARA